LVFYVVEESNLIIKRKSIMAVQVQQPLVSTLNPKAPLFVPASVAAVTYSSSSPCVEIVVEDFSVEWWSLVQTCPEFREQWVRDRLSVGEEQESFEAEMEEIADLEAFLEEQEEMQELEEALYLDVFDEEDLAGFLEDDLSLSNINQVRDVKLNPKEQAPWCKPVKNLEKVPCKAPNSTKKGAQYRIQQPRAVM